MRTSSSRPGRSRGPRVPSWGATWNDARATAAWCSCSANRGGVRAASGVRGGRWKESAIGALGAGTHASTRQGRDRSGLWGSSCRWLLARVLARDVVLEPVSYTHLTLPTSDLV